MEVSEFLVNERGEARSCRVMNSIVQENCGGARANPARGGGGLQMTEISAGWIRPAAIDGTATVDIGSGGKPPAEAAIAHRVHGAIAGP